MPRKVKRGGVGGGGAGGGGGLKTEEEKLVFLQQKVQAEEEMVKKKEEILTLFLKDKLQKEQRNSGVNLLKLDEGWRSILRQTRAAELRKDVDVLRQTFDRQLDGLDDVIKSLGRDLQEAELQSAQVRRLHLQHVERVRTVQDRHVTELQQQWDNNLQHLSSTFNKDRQQMLSHCERQRAQLDDAEFTLEQQHKKLMNDIIRVYSDSMAAYESAHHDQMAALVLEGKSIQTEKTQKNQQVLVLLCEETKLLDQTIADKLRLLQKTEQQKKKVMKKVQLKETSSETERDETDVVDDVKQKTRELGGQLTRGRSVAKKRLVDLSVQSDAATKRLQTAVVKGQRVLRVAEMCRKLENAITPWSNHSAETEEEGGAKDTFPELRRATRHVTAALLQRDAARTERERLRRDNVQLRTLLRQHLDAMTLSDHAALTVNHAPTTTTMAPLDKDRRPTVVEAGHVVRETL
ncbi:dynein regulatory complex subunit 2 isoform X2 [Solea solea]|uniref:dynein regulatory complex subunit 2 isoform X2 n=1 Tax=Solea solea TaxID=90069 RepID=UPI00272B3124|nr:dynein regulatory complex subunit 2 isoform X2 [Solea solea]